jgi:hypothetical protein
VTVTQPQHKRPIYSFLDYFRDCVNVAWQQMNPGGTQQQMDLGTRGNGEWRLA